MDSLFLLGDGDRAAFLQQMMQSFRCLHICLWSYLPHPSNCLLAVDGLYREISSQQPSSSSGNLAMRLFDVYRESVNYVDTGRIPGFALKNNLRYMELKLHDLQRMASHEVQLQFYQEAGIKTVVFMGCATGEIELGMSNDHTQVDLEKEMKNLFSVNFSRPAAMSEDFPNHPLSSSSSSLRSLSVDSPEYSPLLFNINPATTTTVFVNQENNFRESLLEETLRVKSSVPLITTSPSTSPPASAQTRIINNQFPMTGIYDPAMTKAILAVLTLPSTSSAHYPSRQNLSLPPNISTRRNPTAFRRNLSMRRRQELEVQGNRPTNTQLHHMISERKRREKLNESFQVLRSLLPPGTKKDKTSVLSSTTEYLSSLRSQVDELSKRNQMLESQHAVQIRLSEASREDDRTAAGGVFSVDQRINVEIVHVSSSNLEARFLDLRVRVRSLEENNSMLDLVTRMLLFFKQQTNVSLLSLESNTRMLELPFPVHEIMMRLKTEGYEFDESGFGEAVKRAADDQPN